MPVTSARAFFLLKHIDMQITKYFLLLSFGLFMLNSCDQKTYSSSESDNEEVDEIEVFAEDFDEHPNAKMMRIIDNSLGNARKIESLNWEKQTETHGSEFIQIEAYLDEKGFPIKIVEYFINGNFQPEGLRNYYLEDNNLIGYSEMRDEWVDESYTIFKEKRTLFEDSQPVITQERSAYNYDEAQDSTWTNIQPEGVSLIMAEQILSGSGRFDTHFISVVKGDNLFLVLGENKAETLERYTTSVMVTENSPFIEDLLENLDEYKFRPINISYDVIGGGNEPEFRILTGVSWR